MFRGYFVDRKELVLETNGYLKRFLLTDRVKSYVGPRRVQAHDFNRNDPAHLKEQGRRSALLLNIIRNKISLQTKLIAKKCLYCNKTINQSKTALLRIRYSLKKIGSKTKVTLEG